MTDGSGPVPGTRDAAGAPAPQMARRAGAFALAGGLALLLGASGSGGGAAPATDAGDRPMAVASLGGDADLLAFYQARGNRRLWIGPSGPRPEALQLLQLLAASGRDGLDPDKYRVPELRAALLRLRAGDHAAGGLAERLLSGGLADYVRDLHSPASANEVFFVDAELAPPRLSRLDILNAAAAAPSLAQFVAAAPRMNPLYEALRQANADQPPSPRIAANLDRLRLLPADARRYVVVDAAGARLWMVEGGRIAGSMRVIVGKPGMETPQMAGLIRFEVRNPYWNIPPDLVRDKIAPRVLETGPDYLARERLELLSDWSPSARVLAPEEVDWTAVAAGVQPIRVRQLPGADNMMGNVKFMLPNRLGIYLHDTPHKSGFARADRRMSSGCVRLEDAERLSAWLYGGSPPPAAGAEAERRVDLPRPVPVYITYLTAVPAPGGGIALQRDVYARDAQLIARLQASGRV
jgi:murein L,D-transpeptidase YcbB/YkuD